MFGIVFVGGSLFAFRQLLEEHRDLVVTLDRNDADGTLVATVFGPFGATPLAGPVADFTGWRLYRKPVNRRTVALFILADFAGRVRPLRFDLKPSNDLAGLRGLAPEAVAEFEAAVAPPRAAAKS